jgi:hypothetical protein
MKKKIRISENHRYHRYHRYNEENRAQNATDIGIDNGNGIDTGIDTSKTSILENGENRVQNRSSIDSINSIDISSNKAKLNDIPLESWDIHLPEPFPVFTSSPNLNLKEKADFYSGYWHCKTCSHKDDGPGMKDHICIGVKK